MFLSGVLIVVVFEVDSDIFIAKFVPRGGSTASEKGGEGEIL